jgi:hypothetical protein
VKQASRNNYERRSRASADMRSRSGDAALIKQIKMLRPAS